MNQFQCKQRVQKTTFPRSDVTPEPQCHSLTVPTTFSRCFPITGKLTKSQVHMHLKHKENMIWFSIIRINLIVY